MTAQIPCYIRKTRSPFVPFGGIERPVVTGRCSRVAIPNHTAFDWLRDLSNFGFSYIRYFGYLGHETIRTTEYGGKTGFRQDHCRSNVEAKRCLFW